MAATHSTALKRANRVIGTKPKARTARDTARQRAMLDRVITRKGTAKAPLTVAELRARDAVRDYREAVKVTASGKVY